jgi:hypothetical protein
VTTPAIDMQRPFQDIEDRLTTAANSHLDSMKPLDSDGFLTDSVRYVVVTEVMLSVEPLIHEVVRGTVALDTVAYWVEESIDELLRHPLKVKALHAFRAELAISDDPPVDGVLGRALDEVAAQLRPYSRDVAGPFANTG